MYHCLHCFQAISELWRSPFISGMRVFLIYAQERGQRKFLFGLSRLNLLRIMLKCWFDSTWCKKFSSAFFSEQKGIHLFQGLSTTDREDTPYWFGVIYILVTTYLKNKISLLFVSFIYAVYFIAFPQGSWKTSRELEWTIILTCKFSNLIRRLGLCHFAFLLASFPYDSGSLQFLGMHILCHYCLIVN